MIFGDIPVAEALGAVLAHGVRLPQGAFKKGRVLSAEDIATLTGLGIDHVVAARLAPDDVPEDEAAASIAAALTGPNLRAAAAFTGRANLVATASGVLTLDRERIDRANAIDEAVTVATLPPFDTVAPDGMVATVKIIPFAVKRAILDQVLAILAGSEPALSVAAFRPMAVRMLQTKLRGTKSSVLDSTAAITRARVEGMGGRFDGEERVAHETLALTQAIEEQLAHKPDMLLIVGASAVVDRRDVIPAAIEAAGGAVEHFGMPVDPGNLLLIGRIDGMPVIGMPGCARSPKLNGVDWVLHRFAAGIPVDRAAITAMGVGGLLKEIPTRPQPRAGDRPAPARPASPQAPRITAVVLAAGMSRRMGRNKLVEELDGVPLVTRVVDMLARTKLAEIVVVTGHEPQRVEEALADRPVRIVHNRDYAGGMSTSVKTGVTAVEKTGIDGALFVLGDMPLVPAEDIAKLVAAFNPVEGRAICVPVHRGRRGNPILWAASLFPEMHGLEGDAGARRLIDRHADLVCEVSVTSDGILVDVDTPDALAALAQAKIPAA